MDIYLDGRIFTPSYTQVPPLSKGGVAIVATNVDATISGTPGDHQFLLRTTSSALLLVNSFDMLFNTTTIRSTTFGLNALNVPQEAWYIDNTGDAVDYSPDDWEHEANFMFANNKTISRTSKLGAWVELSVLPHGNPTTWIYGALTQESSWAKAQVFKVRDGERVLGKEAIVRVGGDEFNQKLDIPLYQVPLYYTGQIDSTQGYIFRLTLLNGTMTFDFARSESQFYHPDIYLQLTRPTERSSQLKSTLLAALIPTLFVILVLTLCYWVRNRLFPKRYEINDGSAQNFALRRRFVGTFARNGSSSEATPVPLDVTVLDRHVEPNNTAANAIQTGNIAGNITKLRMRNELQRHDGSSNSVAALLRHHGQQRDLVGQMGHERTPHDLSSRSEVQVTDTITELDGSLLFAPTHGTSSCPPDTTYAASSSPSDPYLSETGVFASETGEEEPEPLLLTHEDLAIVFQRATELRDLHGIERADPGDSAQGQQSAQLEALARQLAGVS
ncbi:SubName: Full=Uncharacterized protein {ECO:0000313/EMBL:CCA66981.1} [Serendipita indica DSM 11827]|nr:SubName: Full=Uncharacterized protein {ECO:0000313/EMBL:CCA66981.1} [Serendipita indica DSM 11827]